MLARRGIRRAASRRRQSVIALWLGHESIETTQIYLDANLKLKEKMLAKTTPPGGKPGLYKPDDALLAFLKGL